MHIPIPASIMSVGIITHYQQQEVYFSYMVKGFEKMILHNTFQGFITSMLIMNT